MHRTSSNTNNETKVRSIEFPTSGLQEVIHRENISKIKFENHRDNDIQIMHQPNDYRICKQYFYFKVILTAFRKQSIMSDVYAIFCITNLAPGCVFPTRIHGLWDSTIKGVNKISVVEHKVKLILDNRKDISFRCHRKDKHFYMLR